MKRYTLIQGTLCESGESPAKHSALFQTIIFSLSYIVESEMSSNLLERHLWFSCELLVCNKFFVEIKWTVSLKPSNPSHGLYLSKYLNPQKLLANNLYVFEFLARQPIAYYTKIGSSRNFLLRFIFCCTMWSDATFIEIKILYLHHPFPCIATATKCAALDDQCWGAVLQSWGERTGHTVVNCNTIGP